MVDESQTSSGVKLGINRGAKKSEGEQVAQQVPTIPRSADAGSGQIVKPAQDAPNALTMPKADPAQAEALNPTPAPTAEDKTPVVTDPPTISLNKPTDNEVTRANLAGVDTSRREDRVEKIYTCHPIKNLSFGNEFKFVNSTMTLTDPKKIEKFDAMLADMKPAQRHRIRTLDLGLAEKMAKDSIPQARRGFDSGKNPAVDRLARANPKVGTVDMGTKAKEGN